MDMSVGGNGTLWQRITLQEGLTAISHYFVMDWASVWMDIVGGLLIAGGLGAVRILAIVLPGGSPHAFEDLGPDRRAFGGRHRVRLLRRKHSARRRALERGISFGGVIAFIMADLIVLPVLNIYRKYYGLKMAGFLFLTFYAAMAGAALIIEMIFGAVGLIPAQRNARVVEASITWDYTTWLNIAFLALAALLVWRFLRTGGPEMLRMMNRPAVEHAR